MIPQYRPKRSISKRRGFRKNPMLLLVSPPPKLRKKSKKNKLDKILMQYEEKKPIYYKLITVLREIINKKYNTLFKTHIKKGAFSKNSDFFHDILILSDKNTPFKVQKELLLEILPSHVYSIKKEELEQICEDINSCGPIIRSKIFFYFFCNTFNKKITKGQNLDLKMKIYVFKKKRIINRLKKFDDAFCNNCFACSDILNRIFRITSLFKPSEFEEIFTLCLDMITKYNKKNVKINHTRKGKCIMKQILSIMENYGEDLELLKKLLGLAIRKKTKTNIEKVFKDLNIKALTRTELILEIDKHTKPKRGKK